MGMMDNMDLLNDVSIFLRETLAQETLSERAQNCRHQLLLRLDLRNLSTSPNSRMYLDMSGGSPWNNKQNNSEESDVYEVFHNSSPMPNQKQENYDDFDNNVYDNFSLIQEENIYANNEDDSNNSKNLEKSKQIEDNTYNFPSSPLANTPVIPSRLSLPSKVSPSSSNSDRSSFASNKTDSMDKNSDSSSIRSSSTKFDENPESPMSASYFQLNAIKCGVLGRKEKFLLLEYTKSYWVAAHNQTLYLFNTEKDLKPVHKLDIARYTARAVVTSTTNFKFELVSPGRKTHQFSTEKETDVKIWIKALNSMKLDSSLQFLPQAPDIIDGGREKPEPNYLSTIPRPIPTTDFTRKLEEHIKNQNTIIKSATMDRYTTKPVRKLPLLPHESPTANDDDDQEYVIMLDDVNHRVPKNEIQSTTADRYSSKPKEARELPLLPHEYPTKVDDEYMYLPKEPYRGSEIQRSSEYLKDLPQPTYEPEVYDCPGAIIRPVNPPEVVQEEVYSVIGNEDCNSDEEAIYKNIENTEEPPTEEIIYRNTDGIVDINSEDDNTYYNMVQVYPEADTDQESFYHVVSEQRAKSSSPIPQRTAALKKKSVVSFAVNEELKLKLKPPVSSNTATIHNKLKVFNKPNITMVRPPVLNKSYR